MFGWKLCRIWTGAGSGKSVPVTRMTEGVRFTDAVECSALAHWSLFRPSVSEIDRKVVSNRMALSSLWTVAWRKILSGKGSEKKGVLQMTLQINRKSETDRSQVKARTATESHRPTSTHMQT